MSLILFSIVSILLSNSFLSSSILELLFFIFSNFCLFSEIIFQTLLNNSFLFLIFEISNHNFCNISFCSSKILLFFKISELILSKLLFSKSFQDEFISGIFKSKIFHKFLKILSIFSKSFNSCFSLFLLFVSSISSLFFSLFLFNFSFIIFKSDEIDFLVTKFSDFFRANSRNSILFLGFHFELKNLQIL
jgi:hypothetical protein